MTQECECVAASIQVTGNGETGNGETGGGETGGGETGGGFGFEGRKYVASPVAVKSQRTHFLATLPIFSHAAREQPCRTTNHLKLSVDFMPANGWTWSLERRIASDPAEGRMVVSQLLEQLEQEQWTEGDVFAVHLALEEALVNAIKHGNGRDVAKSVDIVCRMKPDRMRIQITDEGDGFDPESVPDPTEEENLEVPSGRGLMLMRCYMTSVEFNAKGNCVTMEKVRSSDDAVADDDDFYADDD